VAEINVGHIIRGLDNHKLKLMKKLLFLLLITGTVNAQTINVSPSTLATAKPVYLKVGTDAAIKAQAVIQAAIDAKQDAAFSAIPPMDTTGLLKLRGGKVTVIQDPAIPVLQSQATALQGSVNSQVATLQNSFNNQFAALTTQDKQIASAIVTLQAQSVSYQTQLTAQAAQIVTLTAQVTALQAVIDKLKLALQ